uniref:Monoglyceride lipase n=1 Tax=Neogobius melanostomus TaxID=47308 RepID=A0A8C6S9K0_9GOBI
MPSAARLYPQGVPYSDLPHIVNADGLHLFCRYWEPSGPPRALVFVIHGAGEHVGPYDEVAQRLKELQLLVFAHDHVGHGQSEGERMNIKDFQIYVRDVLQHVDLMKNRHPGIPIFLVGHSMGGAISILTACERPSEFKGVVLIAPMCNPCVVQVEAYDSDELVYHGGMRVSFGIQLMGAVSRIEREVPNMHWPFYLLHGDADKLCDIRGSHMMYEGAPSSDKRLKVYEGGYHALHHDLPEVAENVLKEVSAWISERLPVEGTRSPR